LIFSFCFSDPSISMPGVNEWLTIRNLRHLFCKQLLIGRCEVHHGSGEAATCSGGGEACKCQYRDNHAFEDIVIFPSHRVSGKTRCYVRPEQEKDVSFGRRRFHSGALLSIVFING
jgi:hypothetical protein